MTNYDGSAIVCRKKGFGNTSEYSKRENGFCFEYLNKVFWWIWWLKRKEKVKIKEVLSIQETDLLRGTGYHNIRLIYLLRNWSESAIIFWFCMILINTLTRENVGPIPIRNGNINRKMYEKLSESFSFFSCIVLRSPSG